MFGVHLSPPGKLRELDYVRSLFLGKSVLQTLPPPTNVEILIFW